MNFRIIFFIFFIAFVITIGILFIDFLIRPRTGILAEIFKRFRYNEEQKAENEKKNIWKNSHHISLAAK